MGFHPDLEQNIQEMLARGMRGRPMYMGPKFVASPWLFALYAGNATADQASPISMFKAVVEGVEVVTNELTGGKWLKIETDCSIPVTLALPANIEPIPHIGSVIEGKAFITGTSGFWRR